VVCSGEQGEKRKTKEWDYWYDEQCKGEKREVIMALKEYKMRNDEKKQTRMLS